MGSGVARAEDVDIVVKADYLPLAKVNGVFELQSRVIATPPTEKLVAATELEEMNDADDESNDQEAAETKSKVENYERMREVEIKGWIEMRNLDVQSDMKGDMIRALRNDDSKEPKQEQIPDDDPRVVKNKLAKIPDEPTAEERQRHVDQNHTPFRRWCPHCVDGQADEAAHRRLKEEDSGTTPDF